MAEVKRPLDEKMEGKVPEIDAKDVDDENEPSTGEEPESQEEDQ